jgi:dephospho-CoA kinase
VKTVGLTGNVASGKSSVADIWSEVGVPVVRADDLARAVVEPGTPGLEAVVETFGEGVLREDGSLDRDALRRRVFRDPEARRKLEELLHPRIARLRAEWMEARAREGVPLAVAEIPLLYEAGLEEEFDAVVMVDAPTEERIRRLRQDRDLPRNEALRIMDAQMPASRKRQQADFVLDNAGTLDDLRDRALALLDLLRARLGRPESSRRTS